MISQVEIESVVLRIRAATRGIKLGEDQGNCHDYEYARLTAFSAELLALCAAKTLLDNPVKSQEDIDRIIWNDRKE